MRESPEFSEKVIALLATNLDMSHEEIVTRAQKPWGLLQAMKGEWPNYRLERQKNEIESRLMAALEIIKFVETFKQKDPLFVRETLVNLIIERGAEPPES